MLLEEANGATRLACDHEVTMETGLQRAARTNLHRCRTRPRGARFRCRSGLHDDEERAQANEYDFQNLVPPERGQGRRPPQGPLVSLVAQQASRRRRRKCHETTLP